MSLKFADLHHHSTLRPYAEYCVDKKSAYANIWTKIKPKHKDPEGRTKKYTQSDFTSLVNGEVKVAFPAVYSIEQGWFNLFDALGFNDDDEFENVLNNYSERKMRKYLKKKIFPSAFVPKILTNSLLNFLLSFLGHLVTALPYKRIKQILKPNYNYFDNLKKELQFLENQCVKKHDTTPKIPNGNKELLEFLKEKNTMVVIPTVEGAASFLDGNAETIHDGKVGKIDERSAVNCSVNASFNDTRIIKNIKYIKDNHNIFFVTLSHHFYNGFNGHAQSIYGKGRIFIDQMFGKGNVITPLGFEIIKCFLSIEEYKKCGYRILIDTKHMSVPARIEYYKFIDNYNSNNKKHIPIITSHSAFSGIDELANLGENHGEFSNYEINIATYEVEMIYKWGGLIGINFDQNVLSKKTDKTKSANSKKDKTKKWTKEQWAQLVIDNLFGMVRALDKKNGKLNSDIWNIFTIGSDFDGFIDPLNDFATADKFPDLNDTLIKVLNDNKTKYKRWFYKLTPQEIVRKFMGENAIEFLKTNYKSKIKKTKRAKKN